MCCLDCSTRAQVVALNFFSKMHAKMTIGDHVALWNGSLRHKMHTPAPPRLPCWSSAQVTLVYNGPLTQDKPLSVGAAQKTSCVPQGISHPPSSQESLAATTRVAARGQSSLVDQIAAFAIKKHSFSTRQQANLGKRKPCSVSQLFPKKIEGNAQSPRAARRDRSQPLAIGTSVLQTLQSRRAPSPSPGQTILAHLKCTSHNHRHEVYTGPLTQEKPLSQGCSTED